jgi:hypothetical protein
VGVHDFNPRSLEEEDCKLEASLGYKETPPQKPNQTKQNNLCSKQWRPTIAANSKISIELTLKVNISDPKN